MTSFAKIKQERVDLDHVIAGTGRGGSSAVATPKLRQLKRDLVDDTLPGSIFVNIGEPREEGGIGRDWDLCKQFGFISAGHGARYANSMKRIKPGTIIFAYTSGSGYVGIGTALEPAVPINQFLVDGVSLQNRVLDNPGLFHHADDPEMCEWIVRVKWDKVLERDQAIYRTGLFVYVATSCRIKDPISVQHLRSAFNSFLEAPILTEADRLE